MLIYKIKQIRELEKLAGDRFGISEDVLMQRAGFAACERLLQLWPKAKCIGVVAGSGNNGGDGYLLALAALKRGIQVHVWQVDEATKLTGSALHAYEACKQAGVPLHYFNKQSQFNIVEVLVDAMLGIGIKDEVRGSAREAILAVNQSKLPVLAMDVPSGVDADTGKVHGVAIHASATLTFIGLKLGLLTGPGLGYTGDLYYDDLQLPSELFQEIPGIAESISIRKFSSSLRPRPRHIHKGDCGHVLLVGGDYGYSGAVRLAAEAALRTGAGLVSVATRKENAYLLNASRPEIMCHGIEGAEDLQPLLAKATVIVIGPGLAKNKWAHELLTLVLKEGKPLVLDADALNLLAENPVRNNNWILTPHPGEAARLLNTTAAAVQQDRLDAIIQLEKKYAGVIVLKGPGSLVTRKDALPALCSAGNPGMATAGMGDVLTGVIAGLIAQGISLSEAATLGVCLHAEAGDRAANQGERGMIASDLFLPLRALVNLL
jgi:ADP-dependent NAD(P)H-hydrate dehydratase / NAD(P)H-hydrate epimerase